MYLKLFVGHTLIVNNLQDIWENLPTRVEKSVQTTSKHSLGLNSYLNMRYIRTYIVLTNTSSACKCVHIHTYIHTQVAPIIGELVDFSYTGMGWFVTFDVNVTTYNMIINIWTSILVIIGKGQRHAVNAIIIIFKSSKQL